MSRVLSVLLVPSLASLSLEAAGETLYRYKPDELVSGFLLGTDYDVESPTISDNGRYVALEGDDLEQSGDRVSYLVDRENPENPQLVGMDCDSNDSLPQPGPCEANSPRLSGNSRYVIFDSRASFTAFDGAPDWFEFDRDVFLWDRSSNTTTRVSLGLNGAEPDGASWGGDISRDGRYVVFNSTANNLVTPPAGAGPVFGTPTRTYWKDMQTGTVKLVYDASNLVTAMYARIDPRITDNGRYVLTRQTDLQVSSILNWDALTGSVSFSARDESQGWGPDNYVVTSDRRRISSINYFPASDDYQVSMNRITSPTSTSYSFSLDVALGSGSEAIAGIAISSGSGFLGVSRCDFGSSGAAHTMEFGTLGNSRYGSVLLNFGAPCFGRGIDMTPDGRYLVVSTYDVGPSGYGFFHDTDGKFDVYLVKNPLWRPGAQSMIPNFASIPASSRNVKISSDGSIGVFESEIPASEFGAYVDVNGTTDVFRYLADFQQIELVSTTDAVNAFPAGARNPTMSADGDAVAFEALDAGIAAANLGLDGKQSAPVSYKAGVTSIFLRRLVQQTSQRISTSRTGGPPNGSSMNPALSADGRRIGFATDASNINPGSDPNGVRDVVVVDLSDGSRQCVSTCGALIADGPSDHPSLSNRGHVAFESSSDAVQKAAGIEKGTGSFQVLVRNLVLNTSQVVSRAPGGQAGNGDSTRPSVSNTGAVVAFQSSASNLDGSGSDGRVNVFRYSNDGLNRRVSRPTTGGSFAAKALVDGDSLQPVVSGDGRFIAFQTTAANLVSGDGNGVTDLVVSDSRGTQLRRLSDGFGGAEANGPSETPHLNYNGTRVAFHSFATNLAGESDGGTASPVSAPFERENPLAASVVFADAFE